MKRAWKSDYFGLNLELKDERKIITRVTGVATK
jgi:hypothetical protein